MNTHILKEEEFDIFIQNVILPLITRSGIKFGMTNTAVLALVGELGAGKTTFSKKLLKMLGVHESVTSPTFSIINSYDLMRSRDKLGMTNDSSGVTEINFKKALHIDVYRVEDSKELDILHFDEMIQEPNTLSIIEWANMIKEKIPKNALWIYFEHEGVDTRKVGIDEIPKQVRDDK